MEKLINNLILGDNLEIMKNIPDNSIDLIFADPPYNMNLKKKLFRYNGDAFDGVNDEWDKFDSLYDYDEECKKWLNECLRILKNNGSFWVIGSFQNIHRIGYLLQDFGAWIINEIVWEKSNPVPNFAGTRFVNAQETMLWVTKSEKSKFTFNYKTMKYINGGTQMKSIWRLSSCTGKERLKDENSKKVHSTQKPIALLERIILASSNYGDIILDPFSGTGTTAHAAKKLGRKYIGIENNNNYFYHSQKRLRKVVEDVNNDLKFAIYDRKPKKVLFHDLLLNGFISTKDICNILDFKFVFNQDGTIGKDHKSPNKICSEIFLKATNAWNVIYVNNKKISVIREEYRNAKL